MHLAYTAWTTHVTCVCICGSPSATTLLQVGLLNVDGYYDSLLAFIDQAVEEGFISPSARGIIVQGPTAQDLMAKLEVAETLAY